MIDKSGKDRFKVGVDKVGLQQERDPGVTPKRRMFRALKVLMSYVLRACRKFGLQSLRDKLELEQVYWRLMIWGSTNEQLVAMIGDRTHKLLQQALGQQIRGNKIFVEMLLEEAKKRNIRSSVIKWGTQMYNEYLEGKLYERVRAFNDQRKDSLEIDEEGLNRYFHTAKKRQSIRKYLPNAVPRNIVKRLLECGMEAPSSCNRQSWRFMTITNEADKAYISKIRNVGFLEKTPLIICVLVNSEIYATDAQGDKRITPIMDGSAAMMNILNACAAAGLGSCWTNFVASVGPENMRLFKERFSIEEKYIPVSLIAVGFYDRAVPKPLRDELANHWIGDDSEDDAVAQDQKAVAEIS